MAPKRTQPPAMALPTGTAFRKRARKGDTEAAAAAPPAKKTSAPPKGKPQAVANNGKGKQKQTTNSKTAPSAAKPAAPLKSVLKKSSAPSAVPQQSINKGKAKAETQDTISAADNKKPQAKKAKAVRSKQAEAKATPTVEAPTSLRVIVGSYERLLYGFHVTLSKESGTQAFSTTFKPLFSFAAHTSSISAVAAAGADSKWLATGAGDETVRVWDLRRRKEVGGLTGHAGTIHALSFPARTYMLSADGSGLINLYRTRDWALLKTLRGHTGRVNACVAHPSGKVALSVGKDGMLRMWDLMRGKGAGAVRLGLGQGEVGSANKNHDEPLDVQWNKTGTHFAVLSRTEVAVYTTDMQKTTSYVVRRDDPKHKFGCVAWLRDDALLIGNEAGEVDVRYTTSDKAADADEEGLDAIATPPACRLVGHENRVKGVRVIEVRVPGESDKDSATHTLAVTASSDGKIRIFDVTDLAKSKSKANDERREPVSVHNTGGARLTCLDVVGGSGELKANGKGGVAADDEEDDGDLQLLKDDGEDDFDEADLDPRELDELNALLDVIEEAREQGVDVEGLSDFDDLLGEGSIDEDGEDFSDDDDDIDGVDEEDDDFSDDDDDDEGEEENEDESEQEQE